MAHRRQLRFSLGLCPVTSSRSVCSSASLRTPRGPRGPLTPQLGSRPHSPRTACKGVARGGARKRRSSGCSSAGRPRPRPASSRRAGRGRHSLRRLAGQLPADQRTWSPRGNPGSTTQTRLGPGPGRGGGAVDRAWRARGGPSIAPWAPPGQGGYKVVSRSVHALPQHWLAVKGQPERLRARSCFAAE